MQNSYTNDNIFRESYALPSLTCHSNSAKIVYFNDFHKKGLASNRPSLDMKKTVLLKIILLNVLEVAVCTDLKVIDSKLVADDDAMRMGLEGRKGAAL